MYKYEYETVSYTLDGWGPLGGNDYQIGEYRAIIDNRAKNGWRYMG